MMRDTLTGVKSVKGLLGLAVLAFLVGVLVILPIYAGTGTYPLAVVEGNSMYPTLQNGDLVIYKATNTMSIPNGTIVVYVQDQSGIPLLNTLVQPSIIHRVVGEVVQSDGVVYYRTQGDNNQFPDPSLVRYDHILGVPMQVIPKAGIAILFVRSPQGLVATVGLITLGYLGVFAAKAEEDRRKDKFLGALARLVQDSEISEDLFRRLERVVKYGEFKDKDN
jgi:signal peptidase I